MQCIPTFSSCGPLLRISHKLIEFGRDLQRPCSPKPTQRRNSKSDEYAQSFVRASWNSTTSLGKLFHGLNGLTMKIFSLTSHHNFLWYYLSPLFLVLSPCPSGKGLSLSFLQTSLRQWKIALSFPLPFPLQTEGTTHQLQLLFVHLCVWHKLGLMQSYWPRGNLRNAPWAEPLHLLVLPPMDQLQQPCTPWCGDQFCKDGWAL